MGLLTWIKNRLRAGLVGYGGTITTETDDDQYPIAIANEILGGLHGYRTLEELAEIPVLRLNPPMGAMVQEHTRPDGSVFPTTLLTFDPLENDWLELQGFSKLSDIAGYDLSIYWKSTGANTQADIQVQYAPEVDYGAVSGPGAPAFQLPVISPDNYQAGYKSDADLTLIWSNDYDASVDKYIRQRFGPTGKWGIPIKTIGETYAKGDYIDNQFKWVAKNTIPATPRTLVNGTRNNNPEGWQGTPEVPGAIDYYAYIIAHDLFRTTVSKNAYQDIISDWSQPIKISTDPKLVRYGKNPSSVNFIGSLGEDTPDWKGYFTPGDTYMAIRASVDSLWRILNIDQESGEFVDYIFKLFPVGYEPTEADRPTVSNPFSDSILAYPNNDWKDFPPSVPDNKVLYRSVGRKFNNGDLKPTGWSIPTQTNGEDIIQATIIPTTATVFKYANGGVTPASVVLVAKFFRGMSEISSPYTVEWYKGLYAPVNKIVKGSVIGISKDHVISGASDEILTISPQAVDSSQLYTVRVFFNGEDYFDSQAILDVTDAVGYLAVIESDGGFVFKNETGTINFTAKLYNNGVAVDDNLVTFQWLLGNADITPSLDKHTVAVHGTDFTDKEVLKIIVTTGGLSFSRSETLVDLADAKATIWQWNAETRIPDGTTVWTTDTTNAIWARISTDGGLTFGNAFKVKGESAPFNGGFYRNVYKNAVTQPSASGCTTDLFPSSTSGWTDSMTPRTGGENTWQATAFFIKVPFNADGSPNTNVALSTDNWTIQGSWGAVIRINGEDSTAAGAKGDPGPVGWSPNLANVDRVNSDGSVSVVQQVIDWVNLGGADANTKPNTGYYISNAGFTTDINAAKNIKGPQGPSGIFNASDFWATPTYKINGSNGTPDYESWDFRFRKAKNGIIYYYGRSYRNGGGGRFRDFSLDDSFLPISNYVAGAGFPVLATLGGSHFRVNNDQGSTFNIHAFIYDNAGTCYLRVYFSDDYTFVFNGSYPGNDALG